MWLKGTILHGDQTGRTIGFPTINLDPTIIDSNIDSLEKGVHAAWVKIHDTLYKGALYFGPRIVKNETHNVLEIHVLDFDKEVYGETVMFEIINFVRPIMNFDSIEELKDQIKKDITSVKDLLAK